MRRPQRGLTLVELLITVAIVGLVAVVLLMLLMPSDDRRCRLEAERLAAYLTQTRATSVMNDAPARAAFDFAQQVITQEEAKAGADITAFSFRKSDTVDPFTVRKPVKCTALIVAMAGETTSGEAWMVFNGRQTIGGVAVLTLKDAVYSVVVPPNIEGEITVVRGKAKPLTGPAPRGLVRSPMGLLGALPELGLGAVPDNLDPGLASNLDVAPIPPLPPALNPDPPAAEPDDPVDEPPGDDTDDPVDDPPPPPDEPEDDPEDEPDAGPPEDEAECGPERPCEGWLEACVQQKCEFSPAGQAFRAASVTITAPQGAGTLIGNYLQDAIAQGAFNLVVRLDQALGEDPAGAFVGTLHQAVSSPAGFSQDPELPSYSRRYNRTNQGSGDGAYYWEAVPHEEDEASLHMYVALTGDIAANQCPYARLVVEAKLVLVLYPDQRQAQIRVEGTLSNKAAEAITVYQDGLKTNLKQLMLDAGVDYEADTNGDERKDAWFFQMQGVGTQIPFVPGTTNSQRRPCDE